MTGGTPKSTVKEYYEGGTIKWLVSGDIHKGEIYECQGRITEEGLRNSNAKLLPVNSVLIALNGQGKTRGTVAILKTEATCNQSIVSINPKNKSQLLPEFLYYTLKSQYQSIRNLTGDEERSGLNMPLIRELTIPLPPLSIQQEIVAKINNCQRIIDGAKQVVENYKPQIDIDPEWEMVELDEVSESISDGDHQPPPKSQSGVPFVTISDICEKEGIDFSDTYFVPLTYYNEIKPHRRPQLGDILYTVTGSFGIPVLINFEKRFCFQRHIGLIRPNCRIMSNYLFYYLQTPEAFSQAERSATGIAQKTVSLKALRQFVIPLPPFEVQKQIAERIEQEQQLVSANKELIKIFEQKIKDEISKLWKEKGNVYEVVNEKMAMVAES